MSILNFILFSTMDKRLLNSLKSSFGGDEFLLGGKYEARKSRTEYVKDSEFEPICKYNLITRAIAMKKVNKLLDAKAKAKARSKSP